MHNGNRSRTKLYTLPALLCASVFRLLNTVESGAHRMKTLAKFFFLTTFLSALFVCSSIAQEAVQEGASRPHRQGGQGGGGDLRRGAFGEVIEISGSTLKIKLPS